MLLVAQHKKTLFYSQIILPIFTQAARRSQTGEKTPGGARLISYRLLKALALPLFYANSEKGNNKAMEMKLQHHNAITITILAVALAGAAQAATVPEGTQLAGKQELVRSNGSEPAPPSTRIK